MTRETDRRIRDTNRNALAGFRREATHLKGLLDNANKLIAEQADELKAKDVEAANLRAEIKRLRGKLRAWKRGES